MHGALPSGGVKHIDYIIPADALQDVVAASAPIQQALMDLMDSVASASSSSSSGGTSHVPPTPSLAGVSAASLQPLLRLTCMGGSSEVLEAAARLAATKLRAATTGCSSGPLDGSGGTPPGMASEPSSPDEALVWIWMLPVTPLHTDAAPAAPTEAASVSPAAGSTVPSSPSSSSPASPCEAVVSFFTNSVVQLTRRPHEMYELVQELLGKAGRVEAAAGQCGASSVSLLAVASLRSCLKAAASSRMAAADKAAICSYMAGALWSLA